MKPHVNPTENKTGRHENRAIGLTAMESLTALLDALKHESGVDSSLVRSIRPQRGWDSRTTSARRVG